MTSFYEQIGGEATFRKLVERFYEGVAEDDVLGPMYPEAPDFVGASDRLALFLMQYWGGPSTYSETRGHPRLRMRHQAYKVNPEARDRWLHHMQVALKELKLSELDEAMLWEYLERAAFALVNTFDD